MLPFLPLILALAGSQKISDVTGDWKGWVIESGTLAPEGTIVRLKLGADGKFVYHFEMHVMMNIIEDGQGTYTLTAGSVQLEGNEKVVFDDGHAKNTDTRRLSQVAVIRNGQLWLSIGEEFQIVFTRNGAKPILPKKPQAPPLHSDPAAHALAKQVERRYASLTSYSDEGSVTTNGNGYRPKNARFRTRYQRGGKFLFEADLLDKGTSYGKEAVWSDGRRSWMFSSFPDDSGTSEIEVNKGLSLIEINAGEEADLIPTLLMPKTLGGKGITRYKRILAKGEAVEDGHKCSLIELADDPKYAITLWIDRGTLVILRARYVFANEDIHYRPTLNPKLAQSEFVPKLPKVR